MDDLARHQIQKCALASHRITFEHRRDPVKINGKFPEAACLDIGHTQPKPPSATRARVRRPETLDTLRCRKVQTWRHARHFCCALAHLPALPTEIVVSTTAEAATTRGASPRRNLAAPEEKARAARQGSDDGERGRRPGDRVVLAKYDRGA